MSEIKLQVGKTYITREGGKVKIIHKKEGQWPYQGENGLTYRPDGTQSAKLNTESTADIIKEYIEDTKEGTAIVHTGTEGSVSLDLYGFMRDTKEKLNSFSDLERKAALAFLNTICDGGKWNVQ